MPSLRVLFLSTGPLALLLAGLADTNFLGYPVEGYALSNGVRAAISRPRFGEDAFRVGDGDHRTTMHIDCRERQAIADVWFRGSSVFGQMPIDYAATFGARQSHGAGFDPPLEFAAEHLDRNHIRRRR